MHMYILKMCKVSLPLHIYIYMYIYIYMTICIYIYIMHFVFKYLRFSRFGIHAYLSRFAFWTTWRKSRRGAGIVILTTGGNEYLVPLLPVSPLVRRLPVEI